jgi:hypothetical protein
VTSTSDLEFFSMRSSPPSNIFLGLKTSLIFKSSSLSHFLSCSENCQIGYSDFFLTLPNLVINTFRLSGVDQSVFPAPHSLRLLSARSRSLPGARTYSQCSTTLNMLTSRPIASSGGLPLSAGFTHTTVTYCKMVHILLQDGCANPRNGKPDALSMDTFKITPFSPTPGLVRSRMQ